jgi:GNAT superfamily N-acetyltransferase
MHGAIVRTAIRSDLADLFSLYVALHPDDSSLVTSARTEAGFDTILTNDISFIVVAELGHRLISTCTLSVIPNITRAASPYGLIEHVVTLPGFERRGLARAVLSHALQLAWSKGCFKVMLLSGANRPGAHALYESVGFKSGVEVGFVAKPSPGA